MASIPRLRRLRRTILVPLVVVPLALGSAMWWGTTLQRSAQEARAQLGEAREALKLVAAESASATAPKPDRPEAGSTAHLAAACAAASSANSSLEGVAGSVRLLGPIVGAVEALPVVGAGARSRVGALEVGTQIAALGESLCKGLAPFTGQGGLTSGGDDESIGSALRALVAARPRLIEAADSLDRLRDSVDNLPSGGLDEGEAKVLAALDERGPTISQGLRDVAALLGVLAGPEGHRFLIVSQNADELRATGGYIGSAGVVEARDGALRLLNYGSSRAYDTPSDLRVVPPRGLAPYLGQGYWQLAGANWSPSFPDVARQLAYFYQLSRPSQPLDGVVALDQRGLTLLLEAVGPVDVPEYGETISAADAQTKLDRYVHVAAGEFARKQFTAALSAAVIRRVTAAPARSLPALVTAIRTALDQQHLLLYLRDPEAGRVLDRRRWDGALLPARRDALMLVDTEVSSSKQSQEVSRDAEYVLDLTHPSAPRARLTVTYANHSVERPGIPFRPTYRTFLRVYVPRGATLVGAEGFARPATTEQECGRTVFGGEVAVPRATTVRVVLEYDLPDRVLGANTYDLLLQQQPGAPPGQTVVAVTGRHGPLSPVRASNDGGHMRWRLRADSMPRLAPAPLPEPDAASGCGEPIVQAEPIAAPVALEIPTIGVVAPVIPLGVGADGVMEAPDRPDVVGWYRMSARAGQPGNIVMSGHLDWGQRLAVFARLRELEPGDALLVRGDDDVAHTYRVQSNEAYPADAAAAVRLLGGSDEALLTLITCDGVFDPGKRDYSRRRLVRAALAD